MVDGVLERMRAWVAWLEATDHRAKTIRDYRYWLLRFAADTLIDPWDASEDDIVGYLAALPQQGMSRRCLLRAFKSAWSWGEPRFGRNPTARLHLRRPPMPPGPHLGTTELRALIRAAFRRERRRGWAILLMASTGMRIGSLIEFRAQDVDGSFAWLQEAKGGRSYEVALNRAARIAVRHLAAEAYPTLIGVGAEGFRRWLRQAALDAGLERRVHPHLLRHTFATALGRVTDPRTWQAAMGHADLSQYPRYVHTDRERVLRAVESLPAKPD